MKSAKPIYFPARESSEPPFREQSNTGRVEAAIDNLLEKVADWLLDPMTVQEALAAMKSALLWEHQIRDPGQESTMGQAGYLMLASEYMARLRGENASKDAWKNLAVTALQALMLLSIEEPIKVDYFEIRKNRLIRGHCPDCGEGVLLRESPWSIDLRCSERCGFETGNLYDMHLNYPDFNAMMDAIAEQPAVVAQR